MIRFLDNPLVLDEQMALVPTSCYQCDDEIEIGDTCYVDTSMSAEEHRVQVFCALCFNSAMLEMVYSDD